ncbi:hypothetical protein PF005_g10064 [Phytophthora fragariae]|uniref:Uncharacterized protein n=2 Tax=Phytophthora TaxID=4783 RepID=A0A6A3U668_9STRA|nr:hypothetical protein PF003_g519 [Phytophthora fragariae]KAE9018143.1 hypothetical protein PR002_g13188 [Phytophthora rubi]KAE8939570.1 hypothetical protein PF009_g10589 [Phytophthora fragariae]KAE9012055.1 hypothetical protein PF011_g9089 [Phytophthora fragariae]KAE9039733.1 hypothetical protein PR001_g7387 [Phytophthora rubi]
MPRHDGLRKCRSRFFAFTLLIERHLTSGCCCYGTTSSATGPKKSSSMQNPLVWCL